MSVISSTERPELSRIISRLGCEMLSVLGVFGLFLLTSTTVVGKPADAADALSTSRCYELRTYTAADGKLDDLNRRFRKYSRVVFARYHMARLGFWIPVENPEKQFTYILSYADCEDRDPAWEQFQADSLWQRVLDITTHDGDLVTQVESRMMVPADFSPPIGPSARETERVFELRTYTAEPGKREALLERFKTHTVDLFNRHGLENVAYWLPQDSENELVYLLAFPSRFARNEAWREFAMDPEWQRAYEASREDGPLVQNIESTLLRPTDYSPLR